MHEPRRAHSPALIESLRRQIRKAGDEVRIARQGAFGCLMVLVALFGALASCNLAPGVISVLPLWALYTLLGALVAAGAALALSAGVRLGHLARLRNLLGDEVPSLRSEVLLPMQAEPQPETRRIVQRLVRELGIPSEITPAAPPQGRGDEPTPPDG